MNLKHYSLLIIQNLFNGLLIFYLAIYFLSIGITGFFLGLLMGIGAIMGLLFAFHIGIKSDSISQKKLLFYGFSLQSLFVLGLIYFSQPGMILLLMAMSGLGIIIIERVIETLIYKKLDHKKKGKSLAIYNGFKTSSFVVGLLLGSYLIGFGFMHLFVFCFILTIIALIITAFIKDIETFTFTVQHYLQDFKHKRVLIFSSIIFLYAFHFGVEKVAYSPFLESLGIGTHMMGLFMAIPIIALVMFGFVAGWAFDKFHKSIPTMAIGMFISAIGFIYFALATTPLQAFIWRIIHEIGDGIYLVAITFTVVSLFKKERIGGNSGLMHTVIMVATFVGSLIGGILSNVSFALPHIVGGVLMMISFVMLIFIRDWDL